MFLHEAHCLLWKHLFASVLFADDVIVLATSVISGVHSKFTAECDGVRITITKSAVLYNYYCTRGEEKTKAAAVTVLYQFVVVTSE